MAHCFNITGRSVLVAASILFSVIIGCRQPPVSAVLTYRALPPPSGAAVNMNALVDALNERIGRLGDARKLDGERIEVCLYGEISQSRLNAVKNTLGANSILEFRIVAENANLSDRPIIEQAKLLPAEEKVVTQDGKKVAEWVEYSLEEFGPVDPKDSRIVTRQAGDEPQALVLIDSMNVTNAHFMSANVGFDANYRPAVMFTLNEEGASRLHVLTSQNLQKQAAAGPRRLLAIIFDKRMLSAPEIRSAISNSGMISGGTMTEQEVELIVNVLNSGALPGPIALIDEQRIERSH
jgi:preprotein translocase subunit SecD